MKVAVIMPARNAARYIAFALHSLLTQTDAADFDIIVIDDNSSDSTAEIVAELARSRPEVRLLTSARAGLPFARNTGLDAITRDTDIVTFLDADDLSPPGRFRRDLRVFADNPSIEVQWGMTQTFLGDGAELEHSSAAHLERGSQLAGLLIRRKTAMKVGMFNTSLGLAEDVDFVLRLVESRPRIALSPDVAVLYRRHATNSTTDKEKVRRTLTHAYLAAAHRRIHGAAKIPPGIFQPRDVE